MQAGTLREGGRLPALAMDDSQDMEECQCGALTATAHNGSSPPLGIAPSHCGQAIVGGVSHT